MKIEVLNYMLDNDFIIMAEYDNWEDLEAEHKVVLLEEVLEDILT